MTKKPYLIVFFLFISFFAQAQNLKIFTIPKAQDFDTLNYCKNSNIIFIARQLDSAALDSNTYFEWKYGNGISESGLDLDSVSNQYSESQAYYVQLKTISKAGDTLFATKYIRIAFDPIFNGTKSNADSSSICYDGKNNDKIDLNAQIEYPVWKYQYPYLNEEAKSLEINQGLPFTSHITHEIYAPIDKITKSSQIDTIGILLEHSNSKDISIQIICPNGKFTTLKNIGTKKVFLGEPVDNEKLQEIEGNEYWYYFTEKIPDYGTMQQEEQQFFISYTDNADSSYINAPYYPSGSYLPEGSFNQLIGCPYNGDWSIAVIDNNLENNGYIKAWTLIFDSIPPLKTFTNNAVSYRWLSSASSHFLTDSIQFNTTAEALESDVFLNFKFNVTDNYGCLADTNLIIEVQKAIFSAEPASGDAELNVSFKNETNWDKGVYDWNFGDGNSTFNEENPQNEYLDKGEYSAILTATSKFGCINKDTLIINVTAPISKIEAPNVFTPNNDGLNDKMNITYEGLRSARLIVYSRWGQRVAELKNIDEIEQGWNGTIGNRGNKIVPPGIYYYVIIAEGKDDVQHKINGTIHVFYGK